MRLKQKRKEEIGITLVALIITIIVLIILAAVAIFAFTDSGLLNTASAGVQNFANSQEYEKQITENLDNYTKKTVSNIVEILGGTGSNSTGPTEPEDEIMKEYIEKIKAASKSVAEKREGKVEYVYFLIEIKQQGVINAYNQMKLNEDGTYRIYLSDSERYIDVKQTADKTDMEIIGYGKIVAVESMSINNESTNLTEGETLELKVVISPENATDKSIQWKSDNEAVATVSNKGTVTAVSAGTAKITATTTNGITSECTITVEKAETNWKLIDEVAKKIANDTSVTSNSLNTPEYTLSDGSKMKLEVGQELLVKYNGEIKTVRVLGFKHDDLVDRNAYGIGKTVQKASITFDFKEIIDYKAINEKDTNVNGWKETKIRKDLNGEDVDSNTEKVKGLGANLSNYEYIKKVNKEYVLGGESTTIKTSEDWLWLLSCAEIWTTPESTGYNVGCAAAKEGSQYKYYQVNVKDLAASSKSSFVEKYSPTGNTTRWWLRSPRGTDSKSYCYVSNSGNCSNTYSSNSYYIVPGFCI